MNGLERAIADFAAKIIEEVATQRMLGVAEVRTRNNLEYVRARGATIKRLRLEGFTIPQISKFYGLTEGAVQRHLYPRLRVRDNAKRMARSERAEARVAA